MITTDFDLFFQGDYPLPRHGPQILEHALQAVCRKTLGREIKIESNGKPFHRTYEFAEEHLRAKASKSRVKISKFYMIGDNPETDIAGANAKGWVSILVKTGVFDVNESVNGNDKEHPAAHVVENFEEAVKLIYKLENL